MKDKGFTLLELLVVISIVAVLVSLMTVAFSTVQARSRDTRRKEEIKAMQDALEQYYTNNSFVYPANVTVCQTAITSNLKSSLPSDPKTGSAYNMACSTTSYCLCAQLEKTGAGNANVTDCSAFLESGNYYCAANLQ